MKRILVADDKDSSRELIRVLLERSGYEVTEAADGRQALEHVPLGAVTGSGFGRAGGRHVPEREGTLAAKALKADRKYRLKESR